jgi:hypothetical protein
MRPMRFLSAALSAFVVLFVTLTSNVSGNSSEPSNPAEPIFGFRDPAPEASIEKLFLAVPDPKLAKEHLRILTQAPHIAGSPEDKATADYVAQ